MTHDPRNKHHNDHMCGYWDRPNAHTAGFKRKVKYKKDRPSYSSNGFKGKSKDSLLFDSTGYYRDPSSHNDPNEFYMRDRFPRHDRDDYNNRDRSPYGDDDDNFRKSSFGRDRRPSFNSDNSQDRDCYRYDRRERYGNHCNNDRYDNPSRRPSRDRDRESDLDRDRESSNDANRETAIPSKRNIRTDFSIHQYGRLYSDQYAHIHPYHRHHSIADEPQHAVFAARKGTPLRSRWDLEPVNTRSTAIYQYHSDQSSSLQSPLRSVSPTADLFRPSKTPKPETATMPRPPCVERSPSHRPATVLSAAISRSTATSVTAATIQGGFTNHVQHSHLTTRSTILQKHRHLQRSQQKAQPRQPPRSRDCLSTLISTAAETCKALTSLRKQTGIIAADVSTTDLLGKRSVGRPSKVRLETEDAARLGINRAKSEMKAWEQFLNQQQLRVQRVTKETEITRVRNRPAIFRVDGSGRAARLSISAAIIATTSSGSIYHHPQQIQGQRQQEIQPQSTRTLKTRKEWELLRQGLQDVSEPPVEAHRRDVPRQIIAPPTNPPLVKPSKEKLALAKIFLAKPLPPKVISRTNQPLCSHAETNMETQNIEDDDGYLGSFHLEREYRMKAGDILEGQFLPKYKPPQPEACSTSFTMLLKHGDQLFDNQRESSHSEKTDQVYHSTKSRKEMWPDTSTIASTAYLGSMHSPPENVCPRPMQSVKLAEHSCWKERSPIELKRQPVTLPGQQTQSGDNDASVGPRHSILKRKPSLTPSNRHHRVTFADSKPYIEIDSHYATNFSDFAGPRLALPVEISDTPELSLSVSPSPPPLASFTLSSPPHIEKEAVVANMFSVSPASSSVSVLSPTAPSQGSPLSDNSSPHDDTDSAMDCSSITDASDSAAEVEEARRRLFAYMDQLATTNTIEFPDTGVEKNAVSSTIEESAVKDTVNSDNQAHNTNISPESDTAQVSNAESNIVTNAVDKQAEADAARKRAIERIMALPTTHSTQTAEVNRQHDMSFTPTPDYWDANQRAIPYYGYWCRCAMEGRPCDCGSNTYSSATDPSGYYHSHSHYTAHTTTGYYYVQGHQYPASQHTVYSSHEYNWNYYPHSWDGGQQSSQQWAHPAFFGHAPSFSAIQPPLPEGPPPTTSSQPTQAPIANLSIVTENQTPDPSQPTDAGEPGN